MTDAEDAAIKRRDGNLDRQRFTPNGRRKCGDGVPSVRKGPRLLPPDPAERMVAIPMSQPQTVAVINGLADTTDMLRVVLEHAGFAVVDAQAHDVRNGKIDLANYVREHGVDVVLYDVAIPYEDNWRFVTGIRDHMRDVPFVVTTTNQGALAKLVGPNDALEIIGKPYDLGLVIDAVRRAAEGHS